MALVHADDTNFDAQIKSAKGLVVVDFYADWCGPCREFGPVFEEAAKEAKGVKFIKVNTDAAPVTAAFYSILGIPMVIFIKNSKEVGREPGGMTKEQLKAKISALTKPLNTPPTHYPQGEEHGKNTIQRDTGKNRSVRRR